ncbi:hypothetical protein C8R45DRAFT_939057 [Mycena sanguinolenta]|nr:hypothetical protein C8R45DRAFT_939057 [Mycena sanguinolenta]
MSQAGGADSSTTESASNSPRMSSVHLDDIRSCVNETIVRARSRKSTRRTLLFLQVWYLGLGERIPAMLEPPPNHSVWVEHRATLIACVLAHAMRVLVLVQMRGSPAPVLTRTSANAQILEDGACWHNAHHQQCDSSRGRKTTSSSRLQDQVESPETICSPATSVTSCIDNARRATELRTIEKDACAAVEAARLRCAAVEKRKRELTAQIAAHEEQARVTCAQFEAMRGERLASEKNKQELNALLAPTNARACAAVYTTCETDATAQAPENPARMLKETSQMRCPAAEISQQESVVCQDDAQFAINIVECAEWKRKETRVDTNAATEVNAKRGAAEDTVFPTEHHIRTLSVPEGIQCTHNNEEARAVEEPTVIPPQSPRATHMPACQLAANDVDHRESARLACRAESEIHCNCRLLKPLDGGGTLSSIPSDVRNTLDLDDGYGHRQSNSHRSGSFAQSYKLCGGEVSEINLEHAGVAGGYPGARRGFAPNAHLFHLPGLPWVDKIVNGIQEKVVFLKDTPVPALFGSNKLRRFNFVDAPLRQPVEARVEDVMDQMSNKGVVSCHVPMVEAGFMAPLPYVQQAAHATYPQPTSVLSQQQLAYWHKIPLASSYAGGLSTPASYALQQQYNTATLFALSNSGLHYLSTSSSSTMPTTFSHVPAGFHGGNNTIPTQFSNLGLDYLGSSPDLSFPPH